MLRLGIFLFILVAFANCTVFTETNEDVQVDQLYVNGTIYTVDSLFTKVEAIAIGKDRIADIGTSKELKERYPNAQLIDLKGRSMFPGFFDAHAHYYRYAMELRTANLVGTKSWEEVLSRLKNQEAKYPEQPWILGAGWDQNDWQDQRFPTKARLNKLFPYKPVFLRRIDGHAAIGNDAALKLAGITANTKIAGGLVVLDKGKPTGVLIDNALGLVESKIPALNLEDQIAALKLAEQNLFKVGLTSVADAGLDFSVVKLLDSLQEEQELKIRLYTMLNPTDENLNHYLKTGPIFKDRLTISAFKVYSDGALGSRGALLINPYTDDPDNHGLLLTEAKKMSSLAEQLYAAGFQMNTHCIGDSANRLVLDIYKNVLPAKNDRRWRIEHAQVVTKEDQQTFGNHRIIPSVQPTHATSDMYWAGERLGNREPTAYAYQDLLQQNGLIALGSDFPIESINPILGFYAATARQDLSGYPGGGYQPANKLSREQALRGMTIWAAFSNFEEKEKGSLEIGKKADFVVLDTDLMTAESEKVKDAQVVLTVLNGEAVYQDELLD